MSRIIPMCGGHDYAIEVTLPGNYIIVYFITNEGISTHADEAHLTKCINGAGFAGCLDRNNKAVVTANNILDEDDLPEYFIEYLQKKITMWRT